MNLIEAAEQAYTELTRLHELHGKCPGLHNCPTARALTDLMRAIADEKGGIGEFKHAHQWRGEPEVKAPDHTVQDLHDVAAALLTAQADIGKQ